MVLPMTFLKKSRQAAGMGTGRGVGFMRLVDQRLTEGRLFVFRRVFLFGAPPFCADFGWCNSLDPATNHFLDVIAGSAVLQNSFILAHGSDSFAGLFFPDHSGYLL